MVITNQGAWTLYQKYVDGWRAIPESERTRIATEVIAADARYATPRHAVGGRDTIVEDMRTFQAKFPGGHFEIGDVSTHHDVALLTWVLISADGTEVARGHDQLRVSPDGKIAELLTFPPSVTAP